MEKGCGCIQLSIWTVEVELLHIWFLKIYFVLIKLTNCDESNNNTDAANFSSPTAAVPVNLRSITFKDYFYYRKKHIAMKSRHE